MIEFHQKVNDHIKLKIILLLLNVHLHFYDLQVLKGFLF